MGHLFWLSDEAWAAIDRIYPAFAHLLQVKRARPLQHHRRDLTFAFTDMGLQPSRNDPRQLRRKGSWRTRQGDGDDDETDDRDDSWKEQS